MNKHLAGRRYETILNTLGHKERALAQRYYLPKGRDPNEQIDQSHFAFREFTAVINQLNRKRLQALSTTVSSFFSSI